MKKNFQKRFIARSGFTLIELLIVIAILGVLATVVLIAINPLQNLAKARDSGRQSTVGQLGHALEAYATSNNGNYIPESANWISGGAAGTVNLVNAGEISTVPGLVAYSISGISACSGSFPQNGICYNATTAAGGGPVVVYARLEANASNSRCAAATPNAYAVYSSADGRAGIVCRAAGAANEPAPGSQTFLP
jgi:prepilin-type N-terminal cleavage/methylation domain-containing protein